MKHIFVKTAIADESYGIQVKEDLTKALTETTGMDKFIERMESCITVEKGIVYCNTTAFVKETVKDAEVTIDCFITKDVNRTLEKFIQVKKQEEPQDEHFHIVNFYQSTYKFCEVPYFIILIVSTYKEHEVY